MFKENKLLVPTSSFYELLIHETHKSGLIGYFGAAKTLDVWHEYFYWSKIKIDVRGIYEQYIVCRKAKCRVQLHELYTSLSIPIKHWINVSIDFVLGLLRWNKDTNYVFVVDRFSKMTHFITCHMTNDASHIANLFFLKNVNLHDI